MNWPPIHTSWRKILVTLTGVLVCLYGVLVLRYVSSIPDIGLRSAFKLKVNDFVGECFSPQEGNGDLLKADDKILSLDGQKVETWPKLLQTLGGLAREEPAPVDSLAMAEATPGNKPKYILLKKDQLLRLNDHERVTVQNERLVRVEFSRDRPGQETAGPSSYACWCAVRHLPFTELVPSVVWFFLKLGLFTVGALVFWKRPTDTSATQFFLLCIVTLGAYMGGYHWSRIVTDPLLILVFMVCAVLLPPVLLHFCCVFPRPKWFLQHHPGWTLLAIYGLPMLFLLTLVANYSCVKWLDYKGYPKEEIDRSLTTLKYEIYVYLAVAAVAYLASVLCLYHSYRTANDAAERNQVKWIFFGSLGAIVPIGYTLYLAALRQNDFGAGKGTWPMFIASACFTVAFIISITRYRLMQLDQIVSSGMVYFVISFLAVVVYFAVVFVGTLIVSKYSESLLAQALSVSATALVLMLILNLVRSRIKKALDRRLSREKYQLDRTLRRMAQTIEQLVDPPTLAKQVLQTSAEVLGVSRGAVYLRQGTPPLYCLADALGPAPPLVELSSGCPLIEALLVRGAVVAHPSRDAVADPVQRQLRFLGGEVAQALAHEDQLLALLVLGTRDLGPYGSDDLNMLAAFAQLTALALKSAERHRTIEGLNRDLQTKVEKISEQQRRILALQGELMRSGALLTPPLQDSPSEERAAPSTPKTGGIVGSSPVVQQLLQLVKKVSASQSAVLIRGESGTGKELLARALHENSPRAGKAFIKVHCAALSPGLLESELFGHVKGAFTGAHRDKVGRFEMADGGTLFLDEIGDISLEVQTKLLRVLQEMTFERVGSSEPVQVDVRVIAATHQDLEQLIRDGRFREDLYYRLNVISLCVPSLRERCEDVAELAQYFLRLHAQRSAKAVTQIDDDALALLKGYSWPGNIRQLENVIERAVVVAEGSSITVDELPVELVDAARLTPSLAPRWPNGQAAPHGPFGLRGEREERGRRERERLVRALAEAKGNKAEAARALGLARSTLLSRLKKHGLS